MTIVEILKEHKQSIIDDTIVWIRYYYPERTTEPEKCSRDIEYILDAWIIDLENGNTDRTNYITSKFWHNGKSRLKTTDVELLTYDYINTLINELYKSDAIDNLVSITKHNISNPPTDDFLNLWINRRNYKRFDPAQLVPSDLETKLDCVWDSVPMQSQPDAYFKILKLGTSDIDMRIREHLVKTFYYNETTEMHEVGILTAPLTYVIMDDPDQINQNVESQFFHVGLHAGAVLAETLRYGYDCSFFGCSVDEWKDEHMKQDHDLLNEKLGRVVYTDLQYPKTTINIGKHVDVWCDKDDWKQPWELSDGTTILYTETRTADNNDNKKHNLFL